MNIPFQHPPTLSIRSDPLLHPGGLGQLSIPYKVKLARLFSRQRDSTQSVNLSIHLSVFQAFFQALAFWRFMAVNPALYLYI